MNKPLINKLLLVLCALCLSACAKRTSYYLLPVTSPDANQIISAQADQTVYAMRYVNIPEYLTNRYILFFNPDGSVNRDPNRRWVDYPEDNIHRLLALQMSKRLNSKEFYTYPLPQNIHPERIVDINIIEMIGYAENLRFHSSATWQITTADNAPAQTHQFTREYHLENMQGNTLSKAYQRALEELSAAIALTLAKP